MICKKKTKERSNWIYSNGPAGICLLHQQHLSGAFNGPGELPLMLGGKTGVFAWEDAPLVGDVAAKQIHVLRIKISDIHIHFRLGAGSATCGSVIIARGHVT